ncbi:hypothetical protein ACIP98_40785 [Streptomyces sp. NPDC088354]|uniref:hypothetical protein n=1 Tax=Streptomyces sp. NPDC088354 TaxID=3365856 RepID=UPI0037FCD741
MVRSNDTEAHYRTKKTTSWTGYWLHPTAPCDDETPSLITDVTTATGVDGDTWVLPGIHARLAELELLSAEQLIDNGYVTAGTLITAGQEHGIQLIGPCLLCRRRQRPPAVRPRPLPRSTTHDADSFRRGDPPCLPHTLAIHDQTAMRTEGTSNSSGPV